MRMTALLLSVSIFVFTPLVSSAFELAGESRAYLQSRETIDSNRLTPLYEYLDFTIQDMGSDYVSFHFGGWLRYKDDRDQAFSKRLNGDLQYAYMSYKKGTANAVVNLGRLFVVEGVALEQIDGIYARTDLKSGFGAAAFGGVPVETDFDKRSGDWIYGGRITHRVPGLYQIGVSYLKERNDEADFREETGVDVWVLPMKKLEISGRSSYSNFASGWMEHVYRVTLGPFSNLRLTPEVSWVDYKNYFTSATSNAFNFLSTIVDPNEEVLILGGEAHYTVNPNLSVSADYRNYSYDIAGNADYFGGKVGYSLPKSWGAGLSLHRMSGETDKLKYTELRVYAYKKLGKAADVTADFFNVSYDERINGVKNAYAAVVAVGYNLTKNARVAADIEYAHNPLFDKEVKAFLKFLYRFAISSPRKGV